MAVSGSAAPTTEARLRKFGAGERSPVLSQEAGGKIPHDGGGRMSVEVQERVALWRVPDPTEPPLTPEEIAGVEQARAERAAGLARPIAEVIRDLL